MLELGYILLTITMSIIIVVGYYSVLSKKNIEKSIRQKRLLKVIIPLLLWFTYVFILTKSGILANFDLPPRFPILIILPLFIFIGIFLYRHRNSEILHAIPKSWTIYYQTFRIGIESLFVASIPIGILPYQVTFEGYNYDIIFAITAPFIAFLVFNKKIASEKLALAWNYLGLMVITFIIFLFVTTTYFPSVWGSSTSLMSLRITEFPFMLVPGFLMPSAVFVHIISIIRIRKSIVTNK